MADKIVQVGNLRMQMSLRNGKFLKTKKFKLYKPNAGSQFVSKLVVFLHRKAEHN